MRSGSRLGQAEAFSSLGLRAKQRGDLKSAQEYTEKALAIDREIGNKLGQAGDLAALGLLAERRGEVDKARDLLNQARTLYETMGVGGQGPDNVRAALERLGPE
jgi:tetratricopeptide (TPR) repeat protein